FANVDTEKRHRIHERSSAENEKSPASVNLQGFSVRLTISLNPACATQAGLFYSHRHTAFAATFQLIRVRAQEPE
ncbi:hypothetical protein, partial [Pseudomonas sp. TMW22090]|uniref:hypothetical protein n=1 Tax=Pseudomonas sp. TMW22090 TaxID=2506434 RepID=UPI001F10F651